MNNTEFIIKEFGPIDKYPDAPACIANFAEFKFLGAKVFAFLIRGEGQQQLLHQELLDIKPKLEKALALAFEPLGQQRMIRCWWEPLVDIIK